MPKPRPASPIGRFALISALVSLAGLFGVAQAWAFWSAPNAPPPGSTVSPPLTEGSFYQSKAGSLTLGSDLSVGQTVNAQTYASADRTSVGNEICLNGTDPDDCINEWITLTDQYVHLNPASADVGNASLKGYLRVTSTERPTAIQATAADPAIQSPAQDTAAILGQSSDDINAVQPTYGVLGLANSAKYCSGGTGNGNICANDGDCGGGVCLWDGNTFGLWVEADGSGQSWAGRFAGRVGIEGELCLDYGSDCRSSWDDPVNLNYVRVQASRQPSFQEGNIQVIGSLQSGQTVLGQPLASTSVLFTRGDGLCDYGGNGENQTNTAGTPDCL